MIVSAKAVWVHVPKTGGTWVRTALQHIKPHYSINIRFPGHHKASTAPKDRYFFAFVRNPWDWYVSHYYFNRWHWEGRTGGFALPESQWSEDMRTRVALVSGSFSEYLQRVAPDGVHGAKSLGGHLDNLCDVPDMHFYRFEELPTALFQALEDAGHTPLNPVVQQRMARHPKQMVTPHPPYQECYSDVDRQLVAELEADLIQQFGYTFDGACQ